MEIIKFQIDEMEGMTLITDSVRDFVKQQRLKEGAVMIQAVETPVAITLAEKDNPSFEKEFFKKINRLLPKYDGMQYMGKETPGVKADVIGQSLHIMVSDGELVLGVHQGIYALDFNAYNTERHLFINGYGTQLAEGEEPHLPQFLADLNQATLDAEAAAKEEERRVVEEMRREYRERQEQLAREGKDLSSLSDNDRKL